MIFCVRCFDLDVPNEIGYYFYRRGVRKFNADEFIFDHYHQLELIEPVNAEIVTEVRFIYNLFIICLASIPRYSAMSLRTLSASKRTCGAARAAIVSSDYL